MKDNLIQTKTYDFALRIINLCKYLKQEKQEYVLSNQVLKSGTSIGANIEEAIGAQSEKDFFTKVNIAYKEARETHYWIRLLYDSKYINKKSHTSLLKDCEEIVKIISSIKKTTFAKLNK